jgi:hypothetical protein
MFVPTSQDISPFQDLDAPERTPRHVVLSTGDSKVRRMQITLDIPSDVARRLATDTAGLSRAALEALGLDGVRSGKLTSSQARRLLGI